MRRLVLARLAMVLPVLFIMTILTFFLVSLIPGNVATTILGQDATPESIAELNSQLGLDRPLVDQYLSWLGAAVRGDLGTSLYTGEPVVRTLTQRIAPTLFLAGFAVLIGSVLGVAAGTIAAVRGGAIRRALDVLTMIGVALPNFWIALVLGAVVAAQLHLLPSIGYVAPDRDTLEWMRRLILPTASLSVASIAIVAKQTRESVEEGLSRDFIRFMQANGIPRSALILRHGLRYAATPIVAGIAATFVNILGGTVVVETIFAIPGLGSLISTATVQHDVPAVQGAVLAYTVIVLVLTIGGDLISAALTPKVRTR